jgi:hypothetical protein
MMPSSSTILSMWKPTCLMVSAGDMFTAAGKKRKPCSRSGA